MILKYKQFKLNNSERNSIAYNSILNMKLNKYN
jgi:hypothetical protein